MQDLATAVTDSTLRQMLDLLLDRGESSAAWLAASERWIAATWPFVLSWLPPAPARVIDLGCGSEGGFVPSLRANGYEAIGIDPQAPAGAHYQRAEFECASLPEQLKAAVALTSLHHVADPAHVIDRITTTLTRGGKLVVVEWAWEKVDEETADWCFTRLGPDDEAGWLHRRRDEWLASGLQWQTAPTSFLISPTQPPATSRRRSTPVPSRQLGSTGPVHDGNRARERATVQETANL